MISVVGEMPAVDAVVLVDDELVAAVTVWGEVVRDIDRPVVEEHVMIRA
jgi:hypothetical protein